LGHFRALNNRSLPLVTASRQTRLNNQSIKAFSCRAFILSLKNIQSSEAISMNNKLIKNILIN
jgi:hypothetical protein